MIRFRAGNRVYASSHPATVGDCLYMIEKAKKFLMIKDNTDDMNALLEAYTND